MLEEWRGRLGAGTRMQEPQIKALFGASKYTDRLPIGTPEILKSFPHQRLRDFYRDNYRPERMAVVVVGDVQTAEVQALITEQFGGLPRGRDSALRRRDPRSPGHTLRVGVRPRADVVVGYADDQASVRASRYRRQLSAHARPDARVRHDERALREIARSPDAPFIVGSVGVDTLGRTIQAASFGARVQDGRIPQGLTGLVQEVARVRQHGFGASELDRAKREMMASFERSLPNATRSRAQG